VAVVFKDLQKLVSHSVQQKQKTISQRLRNKPFLIWNLAGSKAGKALHVGGWFHPLDE
jgi:hypothetical protein